MGVRRFPAERAGGKKKGPSEVVDDGPRICVTPLFVGTIKVGVGGLTREGWGLFPRGVRVGAKMRPAGCCRRLASNFGPSTFILDALLEGDEGVVRVTTLGLGVFPGCPVRFRKWNNPRLG